MSILDTTIVNVALESLSRDLGASLSAIQWVATGYLLALAAVIPLTGWTARRLGTRRLYLASLVLFTLGSALCGLAWSTGSLIGFRVLQGVGGGMLMPAGQMILAGAAGPQRMGRVMSIVGVPMVLAPVFGPALGGLLLDDLSWRWIFFVNVPVGALAVALALRILPGGASGAAGPIDLRGFALLAAGLPALVFGLSELGSSAEIDPYRVGLPLLLGVALVGAFVAHARRAARPLLDVRLFRMPAFSAAALTTFCIGAALFGAMILLPLYFQTVRGESALVTGLLVAPQGIGAAIAMPLAGRLTDRVGGGRVAFVGVAITALATLPFAFVDGGTSYWELSAAMVVRGFGIGVAIMPAIAAAYAVLKPEQIPDATPQLNVVQRVGGSVGTALLAVVLERGLRGLASPASPDEAAAAYAHAYWWALGITAAAAVPALVLARIERRRAATEADRHEAFEEAEAESLPA